MSIPAAPLHHPGPRQLAILGGFLLLLTASAGAVWLVLNNRSQNEWVLHTQEVRTQLYRLLATVQDAETAQRGYLLAGDETYLEPMTGTDSQISATLAELAQLTGDNPRQQADLTALAPVIAAKLSELQETVRLRRGGDAAAAEVIVRGGEGLRLMGTIRAGIARMQEEETRLLNMRTGRANRGDVWLLATTLGAVVLAGTMGSAALVRVRREATALREAEELTRRANDTLEATVAARTADLQEANEELQRYAYIVGHDLRAPLVNVMGFAGELDSVRADIARLLPPGPEAEAVDRDLAESLGFIRTSTSKMDRLLTAILRVSRAGRRTFTPEPVDMRTVLVGIADSVRHQADSKGATVEIGGVPDLTADRMAVEQVFTNLIDNAVKYLDPARPGRITVRGETLAGGWRRYDVTDNGRGIDTADLERVFELFRRAGVQDQPGEGIGLAFVRALVRRMDGTITCTSARGIGTTFRVVLPARPAANIRITDSHAMKDAA